jgi:hypothetical protein
VPVYLGAGSCTYGAVRSGTSPVPRIRGPEQTQHADDDEVDAKQIDDCLEAAARPCEHRDSEDERHDPRQRAEPARAKQT